MSRLLTRPVAWVGSAAGDAEPQETTRALSGVSGSRATLHKRMWLEGRLERPRTIFPSPQSAVSTASAHLTSLRSESIDHMLVKRSGGYIRNHRPSEQRRLSRLRQRPGRSAGCRSDPSNRARQKARQPASPRPRTRSSNPVPSSGESVSQRELACRGREARLFARVSGHGRQRIRQRRA